MSHDVPETEREHSSPEKKNMDCRRDVFFKKDRVGLHRKAVYQMEINRETGFWSNDS